MVTISPNKQWLLLRLGLLTLALCTSTLTQAIDNPDSPDCVASFHAKAEKFESALSQNSTDSRGYAEASNHYEKFLDAELNTAYRALLAKLSPPQQLSLRDAQKNWIRYRDAEFKFIATNWTTENFGSSSALSRADYRATIVRNRVEQLLNYLKNY